MEYEVEGQAPPMAMFPNQDKASIIEKINPDEIVELLRQRLMGKMENPKTGLFEYIPNLKDNAISEIGAWDLSNLILSVSNSNTSLSKLDDKTIRLRAYGVTERSVHMMISNWREYKITNRAQIGFIAEIMYNLTFIVLKMADAEGIRKMIMGMYSETKSVSDIIDPPKKSLFRR